MYMSERSLMTYYDISRSTVLRVMKYIRVGIEKGKYPESGILYIGGRARVNNDLFRVAVADRERERVMR